MHDWQRRSHMPGEPPKNEDWYKESSLLAGLWGKNSKKQP
jgi:hypothetical protein